MSGWGQDDKTPCEHNESGYPPIADMRADIDRRGLCLPIGDICSAAKKALFDLVGVGE
jgi:hypothetical protein